MPFGPLHRFFVEIAKLQERERARCAEQVPKRGRIRIAIVTARGAPAHERVVTTLRTWDTQVDEAFVLGGIEKKEVLKAFKPHLFFDDQLAHVTDAASHVPCAHVPFGIANRMQPSASTATPIRRQPPGKAVADEREKDSALRA